MVIEEEYCKEGENLKKQIEVASVGAYNKNLKDKESNNLKRKYNFIEHMLSFYTKNKELDNKKLEELSLITSSFIIQKPY